MSTHPLNNWKKCCIGLKRPFLTIEIHGQCNHRSCHFYATLYPHTYKFALTCTAVACWEAKKKKKKSWSGRRSNIFTTHKTRHSIPIKIQQGWYIKNLADYCENLPSGKLTSFITTRKIFHKKLTLMLLLQLKIFPCSHELTALLVILETKIAGQSDKSRQL